MCRLLPLLLLAACSPPEPPRPAVYDADLTNFRVFYRRTDPDPTRHGRCMNAVLFGSMTAGAVTTGHLMLFSPTGDVQRLRDVRRGNQPGQWHNSAMEAGCP